MTKEQEQLEALKDIRKMMQESSRFLSLSGLSGVFAGVYALAGAWMGNKVITSFNAVYPRGRENFEEDYKTLQFQVVAICLSVLVMSIGTAYFFTAKKARKHHQSLFDKTSLRLLVSMLVPLAAGGLFCLALLLQKNGFVLMVAPAMLLFYGTALVNSGKYTVHDIRFLGYFEIILGLLAAFFPGHGILFWALGFGVMHIIYGSIMWYKYDRNGI